MRTTKHAFCMACLLLAGADLAAVEQQVAVIAQQGSLVNGQGAVMPPDWTPTAVAAVRLGYQGASIRKTDGTFQVWGTRHGPGAPSATPVEGLVVSDLRHTLYEVVALLPNGAVVSWGTGISPPPPPALTQLSGPGTMTAIATGGGYAFGITTAGAAVQLLGSSIGAAPAGPFRKLAVGAGFALGLRVDGSLVGWGYNYNGVHAVPPAAASGISDVAVNDYQGLAIRSSDGGLVSWGTVTNVPAGAFDLIDVGENCIARRSDGTVVTWSRFYPQFAAAWPEAAGATAITVSQASGNASRAAVLPDGTMLLTEPKNYGRLSAATGIADTRQAQGGSNFTVLLGRSGLLEVFGSGVVQAPAASRYTEVSAKGGRILARRADGNIVFISDNFESAIPGAANARAFATASGSNVLVGLILADGSAASYNGTLTALPAFGEVDQVAAGDDFLIFRRAADRTLAGSGSNAAGQLTIPGDLGEVRHVACGSAHVVAARMDGQVRAWGANAAGQATVPAGITTAVSVGATLTGSFAVKADGTLTGWGAGATMSVVTGTADRIAELAGGSGHLLATRLPKPRFADVADGRAGSVHLPFSLHWPVTGLALDDVSVVNGTATALTTTAGGGEVVVTPAGAGPVSVVIRDAAALNDLGWASIAGRTTYVALPLIADAVAATVPENGAAVISLPNSNGVAVTYQVVSAPAHGTLSAFAGGDITYTAAADWTGTDLFTYRVSNGAYWSAAATVTVTVRPVNQAPTLAAISDRIMFEDGTPLVVALSGIGPGRLAEVGQILSITTSSSQPGIVPPPAVTYASPAAIGSLSIAPVANAFGSADITVTVRDNGGTADGGVDEFRRTFRVDVRPVNDAPTLGFVNNVRVAEDAGPQSLVLTSITPGPLNEAAQILVAEGFSTAPSVVGHPTIEYAGGATATLRWQPLADAHGQARLFLTFSDDGGTADGGADSVSQSFLVTVDPVNDAPVLVRHDALTVVVGLPKQIDDDSLLTSDVDGPNPATLVYRVITPPARGELHLSGSALAAGGTFTQADINAGLVRYLAPATIGSDAFTFAVGDGIAPELAPASVAITVLASGGGGANPPLLTVDTGTITWIEGAPVQAIFPSATVIDGDSPDFAGGQLTIGLSENATADDRLTLIPGGLLSLVGNSVLVDGVGVGTVAGGVGTQDLVVTWNNNADQDIVEVVLRAVGFSNLSTAPSPATRRAQVGLTDGDGGISENPSRQIEVVPVNTPPTIADTPAAVAFTEGDVAVAIGAVAQAVDDDSPQLNGGRLEVALTSGGDAADRLELVKAGQVDVSGVNVSFAGDIVATIITAGDKDTPLRIDFAGSKATPAAAQAVLRGVRFANASSAPTAGTRTLRATLSDGLDTSAPVTVVVAVTPVNDPPAVALPDAPAFVEGLGAVAVSPNATLGDPDSADLAGGGLTIRLAAGASVDDVLLIAHEGNGPSQVGVAGSELRYGGVAIGTVVGGGSFAPLVVSFNAAATGVTPAVAEAVLHRLAFANASNSPAVGPRSIGVVANDGDGGFSSEALATLQVSDDNSPPVLTAAASAGQWTEDTPALVVAAGAVITDGDSGNLDAGFLAAVIATGMSAGDRLRLVEEAGKVALSGSRVLVAGVDVGSWSGGIGGDALRVDFTAAATPAEAQILVQHIVFDCTSQTPATDQRSILLTINDGDGDSAQATVSVDVLPNNDPPELPGQTLAVAAGAEATYVLAGSDPEGDACELVLVAWPDSAIGTVDIVGAAAARRIRFTPAAGFAGTTSFTARLRETAVGGLSSPDRVFTVRVTGLDEPRPLAASEPPREARRGQLWTWQVQVDASAVADALPLRLQLEGAPAGMELVGERVEWQVPIDQTLGAERFGVRFVTVNDIAGWQDVLIIVRPALGGGG